MKVWTFCYLSDVVTYQVAPVVDLHIEILFLELFLTFHNNLHNGGTFVQLHHVMNQTTHVVVAIDVVQYRARRN